MVLVISVRRAALTALVNQCRHLSSLSSTTLPIEVRLGLLERIAMGLERSEKPLFGWILVCLQAGLVRTGR